MTPAKPGGSPSTAARTLVIFARAPELGRVKSRLARSIGPDAALRVHLSLLHNSLKRVAQNEHWRTEIWVAGDLEQFREVSFINDFSVRLRPQTGKDLGLRMCHSFETLIAEGRRVVLVGSDCPLLDRDYVAQAFEALESGADIVIGPAEDGGYVLVGMTKPHRGIFADIGWGGDQVLHQTSARVAELGLKCVLLETLWDLDTVTDLARYQQEFDCDSWL